ncbi:hypothetical protein KC573_01565, partial [candidate division WWE3 bacterium]|nr:hypothetical protein [candidate division WWE3 bacterium]
MLRKRIVVPGILVPTFIATTALFPLQSLAEGDNVRAQNREEYQELLNSRLTQAIERKQAAEDRAEQIRQEVTDRQTERQERTEQSLESIKERLITQIDRTITHFTTL